MPSIFQRVFRRAVIDLCRIGDISIGILHLEIVRRDLAAVDRSLAVHRIIDRIVARRGRSELILERVAHIRILHIMRRTVACIHIFAKCGIRISTPVCTGRRRIGGADHPLIAVRETGRRDVVDTEDIREHRACRIIRKTRDCRGGVSRRAVIGLRHIAHLDIQLARRNLARIGDRNGCIHRHGLRRTRAVRRTDDMVPRIDDLIVVCILSRQLPRIGDRLLDNVAAAVVRDILGRILRRGAVRTLLRRAVMHRPARKRDNGITLDRIAVAVRMRGETIVDL